ncbi:MAG TPA: MASE3 domain-containing protein [Methanospirillum sp.]|nr:MASE3 domain-containing protein [Methanospirillum sp.]
MNPESSGSRAARVLIVPACSLFILFCLYLISLQNYLLFHGIVELAGIGVALCIFMIVWNTRTIIPNTFFLITGISFLYIESFDLIHTLSYKGMGVFPGAGADVPTELWIAARAFQSVTFLCAVLYIGRSITKGRRYDSEIVIVVCTVICSILYASIFVWHNFPSCFIEGKGLTQFKIISEYVISAIFIATIFLLYLKRNSFDYRVWELLAGALICIVLGELAFTSYVSVYGFMNMLGHLFRLISVYLFYRAIIVVSLIDPYNLLFREIKENELALSESETRFRSLFDHMEEGNALHELVYGDNGRAIEYRILAVNPGFERMLGVHRDDVVGKLSCDAYHVTSPPYLEIYSKVEQTGQAESFETYYPDWDKYFSISVYSPKKGQFATVFTDITWRRQIEKELHQRITDYQIILENVPVMIWYKDTENNFIRVNSAAARAFGRQESDIEGKSARVLFPDLAETYYLDDMEVISTGKPKLGIIERMISANGERLWVQADKVPLRDDKGNISGILVVCVDISERKKSEDALVLSNKKLNLLSSITRHDIGNQLQVIFGYLGLVQENNLVPPINGYVDKALESAQNIERQISFTKDYEDIGVHSPVWQNISNVISHAVRTIDIGQIQLQVDISGIEIFADPLMIKVFYNLVDNAKRYGETITLIRFSGFAGTGGYTIVCEDDGVGIAHEVKSKIFNREYFKHTGFGLNLSREILEITGITIHETGEPGKGARFEILVPEGKFRKVG